MDVDAERKGAGGPFLGREKQFVSQNQRGHDDGASQQTAQDEESKDDIECPNCKDIIPGNQAVAHTIMCFRNSTKCKVCGDVIQKS